MRSIIICTVRQDNPRGSAKKQRAGLRIRPAIEVEGREAPREAVVAGIGVHVLPIADCDWRMSETLVCLREQSTRRMVATFLALVNEALE